MKIKRHHLELASEINVRRFAAYLFSKGTPDLKEWATLDLKWLIDRLVFNGIIVDAAIEKSIYSNY